MGKQTKIKGSHPLRDDEDGHDWFAEGDGTPTSIEKLSLDGLRANIERGIRVTGARTGERGTPPNKKQRERALLALQELFERAKHFQSNSRAYHAEHRDDRYDGLA